MSEASDAGLSVRDLTVRFGGLVAVADVSLDAPAGAITGLIGPNGAGKTTTFNACTGLVTPTRGAVHLDGHRLNGMRPSRRARLGLGRTFQRMELWDSMTVLENVALGPEAHQSGRAIWSQITGSPAQVQETNRRANEALERCHLTRLARRRVGDLSTGQRRLVELARAMATPFRFLLLDEPSSGLDVAETEEFARILEEFVRSSGVGVLLVEHDIVLVASVCAYVYVLDFGQLIHAGPTAETLASDVVRAAYLGTMGAEDHGGPVDVAAGGAGA